MPRSQEGRLCFSVSKDCLADVTADGGGQDRRTGARCKVVSSAVLDEELPPNGHLLSSALLESSFLSFLHFTRLISGQSFQSD